MSDLHDLSGTKKSSNDPRRQTCLGSVIALIGLGVGATVAGRADSQASSSDALFSRYSVAKVYRGAVRLPDFRHRDHTFSLFQTRIRNGMRRGANFAGHFAIIGWGCGTECVNYVIGDIVTGRVFKFPLGGEDNLELRLDAKPTSRLIVARWVAYTDRHSKDDLPIMKCLRQNLVWNNWSIMPLSKPAVVATVKSTQLELCDGL
jgi:hypothetical protein